jgi:hypothetical protein
MGLCGTTTMTTRGGLIRDIKLEIKKKIIKSRKLHKKNSSVSHIHSLFE